MNVRNCKNCGKLFNYITGQPICSNCKNALEDKFQEVKEYLFSNRGASVAQVAEKCDVAESQIRQWVKEERLEFTSGVDVSIVCEICKLPISSGRYCAKCKANTINAFASVTQRPQVKSESAKFTSAKDTKMRFINTTNKLQ